MSSSKAASDKSSQADDDVGSEDEQIKADEFASAKNKLKSERLEQRIFVVPEQITKFESKLVSLPNPRTNQPARFIIADDNSLFEIQKLYKHPSSWFVDQSVQEDGSMFLATSVDPLFFILPTLVAVRKKTEDSIGVFCRIDDIFASVENLFSLQKVIQKKHLELVCDLDEHEGQHLVRLNDDRLLKWLHLKVERLIPFIENAPEYTKISSAQSSMLKTAKRKMTEDDLLRVCCGYIGEYLSEQHSKILFESYQISGKSKVDWQSFIAPAKEGSSKKSSSDKSSPKSKEKPKMTPAQAKLAKINKKGMQSLDGFFKKKD